MKIIQIKGTENTGKSTLLKNLIVNMDFSGEYELECVPFGDIDYRAYFRFDTCSICITTGGDNGDAMIENIKFVEKFTPTIWICATRTKGGSFDELKEYEAKKNAEHISTLEINNSEKHYFDSDDIEKLVNIIKGNIQIVYPNPKKENYVCKKELVKSRIHTILNSLVLGKITRYPVFSTKQVKVVGAVDIKETASCIFVQCHLVGNNFDFILSIYGKEMSDEEGWIPIGGNCNLNDLHQLVCNTYKEYLENKNFNEDFDIMWL